MDKKKLVEIMQYVADKMTDYNQIRAGGNLGTSIQGMLTIMASENIERGLNRVADELSKISAHKVLKCTICGDLKNHSIAD